MESLLPYMEKGRIEAGCDEAGRGPLAGSVFAAAVILPPDFFHPILNDSKQLTEKQRDMLRPIIEAEAVAWKVEELSPGEIDELNILWASVTGMQRAVLGLAVVPDFLLIDGNRFRPFGTEALTNTAEARCRAAADRPGDNIRFRTDRYATVVKGDATYASIAAASVLAKTYRDAYMRRIAAEYPGYGWEKNMGYPTPDHIEAIRRLGYTPYHRRSFHPSALEPTLF